MATIRLTRQSRSRGKKRRQIYDAEVTCEQMNLICKCDHCKQETKPWTSFRVTIIQNQRNYLYPPLSSQIGTSITSKVASFLRPKARLCIKCMYEQLDQANRVLGLRQR